MLLCALRTCRYGVDPLHQLQNAGRLSRGLHTTFLLLGGEQALCREQKDLLRKRLTLTLYQAPENPMAPTFYYFHCSQDNLFNIHFFAMPGGQQIQDFFIQGNAWTQIPSPKSLQLTVQQPKALPVTSWACCCHWGCCLCFQQGLGFHPPWLQRVTIFPLINATAFWGRHIFQNGVALLKNHKKLPGKIKDCKCAVVQCWLHFKQI